jgi:4-hydroxy-2-oxoheptanedioate aldolase
VAINRAKQRMLEGKAAIGAEISLGSPLATEFLSQMAFDFFMVDAQHGPWSDDTVMQAFRCISLGNGIPMARVEQNDFGAIGRLLDRGALGIVVPMVNSVAEAEAAAFAVRFPPEGGRSGGPFGVSFHGPDYMSWSNDEVFLAVMIETRQAVERVEEIMAVAGVDGCYVGPNDLRISMGVDLNTAEGKEAHRAAILKVVAACRKTNKISGISTGSAADAQFWIEQGCRFVTAGEDAEWMTDGAKKTLQQLGRSA